MSKTEIGQVLVCTNGEWATNTPSPTDEDRELIEMREWLSATADLAETPGVDPAAFMELVGKGAASWQTRLESLLSDRAKLEEALREIATEPGPSSYWLKGVGDIIISAEQHCARIARAALNRSTDRAT